MRHICAKYLPITDAVTTVNQSIAKLYDEQFGCNTEVVRNANALKDLSPSKMIPGYIRLAHSGAAVPGRDLETLIEATLLLDERFSLDQYLVKARGGGAYWNKLRQLSQGSNRITFHDAVAPQALPVVLNQYDLGVFIWLAQTINHRLMLPNKFFDFVQARLGLVFSPAIKTSALINEHQLGIITEGFSAASLVKALSALSQESVAKFKSAANRAADSLSSKQDVAVQRALMTRLLSASVV